jgi:hypothetical protein
MKQLSRVLLFLFLISVNPVSAQQKVLKNNEGFGVNYVPRMTNGMYFDTPFDFWPNNEPSAFMRIFYFRQLNESVKAGAYFESGKNRFSDKSSDSIHSFRRNIAGIEWLACYPRTRLHMQLGGYFGYGMIKANHWDNLKGVDFGMLAGPAFETMHFGISIQMKAGFAPFSSGGSPEGILMYTPGFLVRLYGKF